MFGAASLGACLLPDLATIRAVLERLEGQLTAAVHLDEADHDAARALMPVLELRVGRILSTASATASRSANAMVHGGPYPATSDGRTTSVGTSPSTASCARLSYQDLPDALRRRPSAANPLGLLPSRMAG